MMRETVQVLDNASWLVIIGYVYEKDYLVEDKYGEGKC
jgi:hypothetical protein